MAKHVISMERSVTYSEVDADIITENIRHSQSTLHSSTDSVGMGIMFNPSDVYVIQGKGLSESQKNAYVYMNDNKIEDFISFLISHLLAKTPEDPISYLIDIIDQCIEYKDGLSGPPLLFAPEHQESVYSGMDVTDEGRITYEQYCNGMKTLGIKRFNVNPTLDDEGFIKKETFLEETQKQLLNLLTEMIGGKFESEVEIRVQETGFESTEFNVCANVDEFMKLRNQESTLSATSSNSSDTVDFPSLQNSQQN